MAAGDKIYIADKETLDAINNRIGSTTDTGGTASAGSIFGKLNAIISSIASHVAAWTAARATKVDNLDTTVSSRQSEANALSRYNQLNTNTGVNNTASATGTLSQKLSHAINTAASRQSEADAASRYTQLNTNTGVNNTASATGTLSQKLSHIINLFSSSKQKVLVSKVVNINIATAGTHTFVNVIGAGQFEFACVTGAGASYAPLTIEIDGNPFVISVVLNKDTYIARAIDEPSVLLQTVSLFHEVPEMASVMRPIYFKSSLKITAAASNQNQLTFMAHYAVYE